jgi:hypothetical protein
VSSRAADMRDEIEAVGDGRRYDAEARELARLRRRQVKRRNDEDGRLEAGWGRLARDVFGDDDPVQGNG